MFRKWFALSEQGAKDLKKGIVCSTVFNLSLMLPVGLLVLLLQELLKPVLGIQAHPPRLTAYTVTACALFVLILITYFLEYRYTYTAAYQESANRRIALAETLRKLPLSFFGKKDLAELTTTMMGDCTALEHTFSHAVPQLFGALISIILVSIGLFVMNWKLALAILFVFPLALLVAIGSRSLQDAMGTKKIEASLKASDGVQEYLETIRDIKSCSMEQTYLENLDQKLSNVIAASIKSETVTGLMISSAQMLLRIGFAVVVLVGAQLLGRGEIDILTYLIFLLTASRIYDPLSTVLMQIAEIFNAQIQIKRMKNIENQPLQTGSTTFQPHGYDIVFKNVDFSYNTKESVLKNISFTARQGEVTALIGPSGGGKSTAAKLAARFWDPVAGTITLGGVDITSIDPETLLKHFSVVFQDVVLFNDTLLNNIRLGRRDATDEEVLAAAKAAQCDSFISRFSDGYQTVIGENGSTLSGGERQRISIARALLKDAPVILLDEATASLDVENETLIQSALSELVRNKTVLVIAHRMRTIVGADKVVVLENGHISQLGEPALLMKQGGLFRHMVELQTQSSQWALH